MIYDKITNIGRYKGISHWLDIAVSFIEKNDLAGLPDGRTAISGDDVFANVMEAEAGGGAGSYEIHKRYMDIQIDIEGTEIIRIGSPLKGAAGEFNAETDFGTIECEEASSCIMGEGRFIICMAGEPHMPGVAALPDRHLKKCVIKVSACREGSEEES